VCLFVQPYLDIPEEKVKTYLFCAENAHFFEYALFSYKKCQPISNSIPRKILFLQWADRKNPPKMDFFIDKDLGKVAHGNRQPP
jgi:hypothetical protein